MPFVLRLLSHPNADQAALLEYVEAVTSSALDFREEALGWDDDSDDRVAVLGTLEGLEREFAQVAPLVDSGKPGLVAFALALAPRAGQQGEALLRQAAKNPDWLIAATAVYGLLDQRGDSLTADEAVTWLAHQVPIVRMCAAIVTSRHLEAASPPATSTVLCEALEDNSDLPGRFSQLPFVKGSLLSYVALNLAKVRDAVAMAQAVGLAARLNDLDLFTLDSVSFGLLKLCFGEGKRPFAPRFIEVLEAIGGCGRLENFANFQQSSARFGLPSRASGYRALAEELRRSGDPTLHMEKLLQSREEDEDDNDAEDE